MSLGCEKASPCPLEDQQGPLTAKPFLQSSDLMGNWYYTQLGATIHILGPKSRSLAEAKSAFDFGTLSPFQKVVPFLFFFFNFWFWFLETDSHCVALIGW